MSDAASKSSPSRTNKFREANSADVSNLAALINAAFAIEEEFIGGPRTNDDGVRAYMQRGKFLVAEENELLVGCVYLEIRGDRGYLGLLSVDPLRQKTGLGRVLVAEAESFFRRANCHAVDLRMVSARTELPPFYRHLGYVESGTESFTPDTPSKAPCHFVVMSKSLA
jgi:GNAT superfamily N-acetyltransferase